MGDDVDKIDEFKIFVKKNPNFALFIKDNSMTWQKFYELYDMYGEDSSVWDDFKIKKKNSPTLSEIVEMAKKIDVNKLQDGVNSLSKAVSLFGDLFQGKEGNVNTYTPRAIYQRFDD